MYVLQGINFSTHSWPKKIRNLIKENWKNTHVSEVESSSLGWMPSALINWETRALGTMYLFSKSINDQNFTVLFNLNNFYLGVMQVMSGGNVLGLDAETLSFHGNSASIQPLTVRTQEGNNFTIQVLKWRFKRMFLPTWCLFNCLSKIKFLILPARPFCFFYL